MRYHEESSCLGCSAAAAVNVVCAGIGTQSGESGPVLDFNGTTATCSVSFKADSATDKVAATLTLYQSNTYVDSWTDSGTGRVFISESCKVESGKSYRLVLSYSINGAAKPAKEVSGTYP